MSCRGCFEFFLKLLNFLLTLVGYGIYLFVEYKNAAPSDEPPSGPEFVQLGRPMMMAVTLGANAFDNLPKAWFIYLYIGVGAVLVLISCCGCISTATRNGCCLTCYSVLVILLILVELGCAAFIFFKKDWEDVIPTDKTGNFEMISDFLEDNWDIIKWVALGIVVLQAFVFLLALAAKASNSPAEHDSDDEYITPGQQIRQPLITPTTGVPVSGALDSRPSRNDAWSQRMREKYGLDTSEFTYNSSQSNRNQQNDAQPTEEKSCCTIM
ncbi:scaffold/adaptor protein [Lithospermum erythrorhizon]|uniref:Scaffold/adaptor protein n=1 Tax=Lithospermum erythrorhizon TaxID=34254 RepID=A0AAV3Q424_LITER